MSTEPTMAMTARHYDQEVDGDVVLRQIALGMQPMILLELDLHASDEDHAQLVLHCSEITYTEAADLLTLVADNLKRVAAEDDPTEDSDA